MTETITGFPMTGISPGQAGPYSASQFAAFIAQLYDRAGVSADAGLAIYSNNGSNLFPSGLLLGFGLDVYALGSPNMSVNIGNGAAIVNGNYVTLTNGPANRAITSNASGNPRIDTVVIHIDYTLQTHTIIVLAGTPAGAPVPPGLTRTSLIWEIPLADIAVANAAASITQANITPRTIPQSAPDGIYIPVLNNSGNVLQTGDVVVWDTSAAQAVKTSTTIYDATVAGVMVGRTAAAAIGLMLVRGVGWVNVSGAVIRGQSIYQSGTAKQAVSANINTNPLAMGYAIIAQAGTGLLPCYIDTSILATNAYLGRPNNQFNLTAAGFSTTSVSLTACNTSTARLSITTSHANAWVLMTIFCATTANGGSAKGFIDMYLDTATSLIASAALKLQLSASLAAGYTIFSCTRLFQIASQGAHTIDLMFASDTAGQPFLINSTSASVVEIA